MSIHNYGYDICEFATIVYIYSYMCKKLLI